MVEAATTAERKRLWATASAALIAGALASAAATAALANERILAATPLVLKDGRIATVSLHSVPFTRGAEALDGDNADALDQLAESIADDCFLTAQVIGHIDPQEADAGDTLQAHRIARTRADSVVSRLADRGLPQSAIASVWDWQFLVREARASIWVFRLTPGEDCDGVPMRFDGQSVASASSAQQGAGAPLDLDGGESAAQRDARSLNLTAERSNDEVEIGDAFTARPAAGDPMAGLIDQADGDDARNSGPSGRALAALGPIAEQPDARPAEASMAVTFDVNSSFFPSGARQRLREFVAQLDADRPLEIELVASVGSGDVKNASNDQAQRYNRWMAERRLKRIAAWFEESLTDGDVVIRPAFAENDASRQVQISARAR